MRILGNDYLEEVFGYQVTIAMLRSLRFHRLLRARLKKPGGKDRRTPNNSGIKYRTRVPRDAKEDSQFDKENDNLIWNKVILK